MQNRRHPCVDGRHQLVRLGRNDCKALQPAVYLLRRLLRLLPRIPQSREGHKPPATSVQRNRIGLPSTLGLRLRTRPYAHLSILFCPLIKSVCRNQTPPSLERLPPRRRSRHRLCSRIKRGHSLELFQARCEEGHQSPSQQRHLSLARVPTQPDHWLKRCRRNVLVRRERILKDLAGMKSLSDMLLIRLAEIPTTHGLSLASPPHLCLLVAQMPGTPLQRSRER